MEDRSDGRAPPGVEPGVFATSTKICTTRGSSRVHTPSLPRHGSDLPTRSVFRARQARHSVHFTSLKVLVVLDSGLGRYLPRARVKNIRLLRNSKTSEPKVSVFTPILGTVLRPNMTVARRSRDSRATNLKKGDIIFCQVLIIFCQVFNIPKIHRSLP